jgi:hypothetical protein
LPRAVEEDEAEPEAKLMSFKDFYARLQRWEGSASPRDLIGPWPPGRREGIAAALSAAFDAAGLLGSPIPGFAGSTPQSRGNKAAAFLKAQLTDVPGYRLDVIRGAGYPDFVLRWRDGWCCAEVKSTSKPDDDASSLRVVLTGSTARLRSELDRIGREAPAPCHLLFTLKHDEAGVVTGMRLDFLEPETTVSVKLEASTSRTMLRRGRQRSHSHP